MVIGNWNAGVFTPGGSPSNAVQVNASLTSARGNAVPLIFAQAVGMKSCNVNATSIANYTNKPYFGLTGLLTVAANLNFFVGSYDSALTTTPTQGSANSKASVYTDLSILTNTGSTIKGNLYLAPGSFLSGVAVTGTTQYLGSPLTEPSPTMQVVTNPQAA